MSKRTKPESGGHLWPSPGSEVSPRTTDASLRPSPDLPLPPSTPPSRLTPNRRRTLVVLALVFVVLAGVVAVIVGPWSDSDSSPSAPHDEGSLVPDLDAPTALVADRAAFRIRLDWEGSDGEVQMYEVTRNGDVVATLPPGRTRWLDNGVFPASRYRYAVRAVDAFGVPSDPATIAVRTPSAPLAFARLQGLYDVTLITESKFGYGTFSARHNTGWRFVPVCDEGACDVDWRDTNSHELAARLDRMGASYEGSDSGRFNIQCHGRPLVSTLTFRLHVTRAKVVGDAWRAAALEGHLTQREGAQLGCRAAGVDYTVRLVLYT
jgi:hypothetical protein